MAPNMEQTARVCFPAARRVRYDEVDKSGFLAFGRVARSIQAHYLKIINFFEKRSTNAASESFNAKIKSFRSQFMGVKDKAFFLFRLAKIYA
jgi:transposase